MKTPDTAYEAMAKAELQQWQHRMLRRPSFLNKLSKRLQTKINSYIPEKVHAAITVTIKQMVRGVLFGAAHTTVGSMKHSLEETETTAQHIIKRYRTTAAVEGGVTGAGGILLGLADLPLLIAIKIKLLFEIAALYGADIHDHKERIFLLHIFELAFSSDAHRRSVYLKMVNWQEQRMQIPNDIHGFDWRSFQMEYRDHIDLAKMAQLIPLIGAPVGAYVNYKFIEKLGETAMNAYRMRYFEERAL